MMTMSSNCYSVLTDEQILKIHDKSLEILERIGVNIDSEKARKMFEANGCTVKGKRVHIDRKRMEALCQFKQKELVLYSRSGKSVTLKRGQTHHHNAGTVAKIFDSVSGEMRKATKKDACDLNRLLDGMENVDIVVPIVYPQDIDQSISLLYSVKEAIKHTSKPLLGPGVNSLKEAKIVTEMFDLLKTSEFTPTLFMDCSPVSPLAISKGDAEALMYLVGKGCPVSALSCPIVGMTAPMSLLGAVTQLNAEVLAILALARLVNPEAFVVYGGRLVVSNMFELNTLGGAPENTIVDVCAVQMAHYYNLASNIYGTGTSGLVSDAQVGFEKGIKAALATLSSGMLLSGIGSVCDAIAVSYEQIVIDNELIGNVRHSLKSLAEDEADLAFKAIDDVMNQKSDFMTHDSSIQFLRSPEKYNIKNKAGNYQGYDSWSNGGKKSISEKAREIVNQVLNSHQVDPIDEKIADELDGIFDMARKDLS